MKDEDVELISEVLGLMTNTPVTSLNSLLNHEKFKQKVGSDRLKMAIAFLLQDNLISEIPKTTSQPIKYELSAEGNRVKSLPGGYQEFLEQKSVKEQSSLEKEQRDDKIKELQLQELEVKMKYLENQFKAQNRFWTIMITASFIASIIALLKAFGVLASG